MKRVVNTNNRTLIRSIELCSGYCDYKLFYINARSINGEYIVCYRKKRYFKLIQNSFISVDYEPIVQPRSLYKKCFSKLKSLQLLRCYQQGSRYCYECRLDYSNRIRIMYDIEVSLLVV